ncbi:MAG TPA: diaminopimelate epimerase [Terriglobales bacterium]
MSPTVPFVKACACGNDFLIIDGANAPADIADFTRRICDRNQGVGADGVEWLYPTTNADIEARLINNDGSCAEISGNGTRCVATYLCSEQPRELVTVLTGAGIKTCHLISYRGMEFEFEAAMGTPEVGKELALNVGSDQLCGIPVSMGNPHFVIFHDEFFTGWQAEAAAVQRNAAFPHGVNIEFVKIKGRGNIDVLFYERGVGETKSSGTGSCAAAVAAIVTHRAASPVRVDTPGGKQTVRWGDQVYLRGSAALICRGEFFRLK